MGRSIFFTTLLMLLSWRSADAQSELDEVIQRRLEVRYSPLRLGIRQGGQDLSFCFGEGAICSVGNDLWDDCDNLLGASDSDSWYQCVCANGYVSVEDACYWCQLAYNLDITYDGPSLTSGCNSASVAIAPIPSSVLSRESAYNATYTGVLLSGPTGSAAPASTSGAASAHTTGKTAAKTTAKNTNTFFGGTTAVTTFNGGGAGGLNGPSDVGAMSPTSTVTVTQAPSPKAGGGSGSGGGGPNGAAAWDLKAALLMSLAALGFGVVMLAL